MISPCKNSFWLPERVVFWPGVVIVFSGYYYSVNLNV